MERVEEIVRQKKIILKVVNRLVATTRTQWDDILQRRGVFTMLSHLVPAIIIYIFAPDFIIDMQLAAIIYMIVVGLLVLNAFLNSVVDIYRTFEFARRVPIRGFMQVVKIIAIIAAGIIIIGLIVEKDPTNILAGLGAMIGSRIRSARTKRLRRGVNPYGAALSPGGQGRS